MNSRFRPKLSYANVVASIALFVALGGAAVAAGVPRNSVGPKQLRNRRRHRQGDQARRRRQRQAGQPLGDRRQARSQRGRRRQPRQRRRHQRQDRRQRRDRQLDQERRHRRQQAGQRSGDSHQAGQRLGDAVETRSGNHAAAGTAAQRPDAARDLRPRRQQPRRTRGHQLPVPADQRARRANILNAGTTTPACPGLGTGGNQQTPEAAAGQLCLYVKSSVGDEAKLDFSAGAVNRLGFGLLASFKTAKAENEIQGFWAVTAP